MDEYRSVLLDTIERVTSENTILTLAEGIRALGFGTTFISPIFGAATISIHPNFVPVKIWKQRILVRTRVSHPYGEGADDIPFEDKTDWTSFGEDDDDEVPF